MPSAVCTFTSMPVGSLLPAEALFLSRAYSASESAKRTQIGSARVMAVSTAESFPGETRLPTDCSARPVMPLMGALTVV